MRFPLMSQKYESVFKCDHSGCPRAETPAVLHDSRHTWRVARATRPCGVVSICSCLTYCVRARGPRVSDSG